MLLDAGFNPGSVGLPASTDKIVRQIGSGSAYTHFAISLH
jgi:hypothetical protein